VEMQSTYCTCSGSYHPLVECPPFLQMPAEERGELVALSDLCRGCLTSGHGTRVQACPFRDELKGLCAKPKCKRTHHQLLHVDGKQSHCPHQYFGGDTAVSKQRYAQAAAAMAHAVHQPPVQLVTQRIKTAAGKSCLAFWDIGFQVTLTTHKAAKEMGLKPISGPPLNLMGVGNSQKTRSTVRYKIPLLDTGGQTVEVAAYGMDHIMAPLEAVDSTWMRAVFPEVPTGGLEAACGRVDLLIGQDNYKLFPEEHRRVENAALHRSRFGTGWIASGRPPGQGDLATSAGAVTVTEEATSVGAATGAKEATSKEEAVNKGEPAHITAMDKPAKPPDRLDEQFAVTSAVFIQGPKEPGEPGKPEEPAELEEPEEPGDLEEPEEPGDLEELEEYRKLEEDLVWDEGPPGEDDWPMPVRMDWSRGCGAEDTEYIPGQARPPARICACIEVPTKQKTGHQARVASMREQLASLLAQPQVRWLSTVPAKARVEPPEAQLAAAMSLAPAEMPKQPQECNQRTPQPQHLRDQPKGHSVRQQQELEEPPPPHMDQSHSQGEEDAMHNSRRAETQDETAARVRAMPPTDAVRGRRRSGQAAEVAEALMPSPTGEDPPAARNRRPTTSGMSAGATAATADGPVAPLPGEPAPMKAEARVPHPADLLALQIPSEWILEAAAATSRDQAQGTAGLVAQCELQPSGKEEGGDEPPLRGLWKGADETGQQGEHTRPCGMQGDKRCAS
jgi:hypothetical protein